MQSTLSEPQLFSLLDDYPDPIFVKDEALRYIYANKAYLQEMKVSLDDLVGSTAESVLPAATANRCEDLDRGVITTGLPRRAEETVELKNNRFQRGDFTLTPRRDPSGRVVGMMGVVRNVTSRYERELNLLALAEYETGIDSRRMRSTCACCKQMKNADATWTATDATTSPVHQDLRLTHGVCDTCSDKLYGTLCEQASA